MSGADIYSRRHYWKIVLAVMGLIIVLITMLYSKYLADRLEINVKNNVELYSEAIKSINYSNNPQDDTQFELLFMENLNNAPVILEDEDGILTGFNYEEDITSDQEFLVERREAFIESGKEPIVGTGYASKVYYENPRLYTLIEYFPMVQVLLLGAFVGLGYFFFSTSRKAEQNRVWAGMAKETAHQLGTPISAIIAWIDHLKEMNLGNTDQLEIINELSSDVDRLGLIADRFSKIGSKPKLEPIDIYDELESCRAYMQRRASKKVEFEFPSPSNKELNVNMNKHLFDWVVENLIRNSLDAMGAVGKITASVYEEGQMVAIDLSDTGKGIAQGKFKTIFQPGFTTKTRGWGLGLSLAKRIIEDYHQGKIFVKNSKLNEGTTFTIKLPKA